MLCPGKAGMEVLGQQEEILTFEVKMEEQS